VARGAAAHRDRCGLYEDAEEDIGMEGKKRARKGRRVARLPPD